MKCEDCCHAEMCKWIDELGGRGCDFLDGEQEPCDDAVSREAFITRYREWMKSEYGKTPDDDTLAIRVIKALPSVTQKSGKWIPIYQGDEIINYRCSECELGDTNGSTNLYGWDYCRRCGAKMVEPQESEDKG